MSRGGEHWKVHKQDCCTLDDLEKLMYCDSTEYTEQVSAALVAASAIASNSSCAICLEKEMKEKVVLPACEHAFCFLCLKEWQIHDAGLHTPKKACPLCRAEIEQSVTEIASNPANTISIKRANRLPKSEQQQKNELY